MSPRRKMPTKAELLQLQKLYKTDERIGEFLGGVPAYLVAYWRRKKGIPKYSLPKFSESEIRTLWERYGDDEKCGLELGLSKAAFYNWRRRYNLREKPAFLKLEQLEIPFPGSRVRDAGGQQYGKQSVVRKILARTSGEETVEVGQKVSVEPDIALVGSEAGSVISLFKQGGVEYVWNSGHLVLAPDILPASLTSGDLSDGVEVREFVKRQGIRAHYGVRDGNASQLALERGHHLPGNLSLGCAANAISAGAVGCLGVSVDRDQMAGMWTQGKIEMTVPPSIQVTLTGRRGRGVFAKDIAMYAVGKLAENGFAEGTIEYTGSAVTKMSVSERFTLSDYSSALPAFGALCPYDATIKRFLTGRTMSTYQPIVPDKDAEYEQMFQIAIDQIVPCVVTGESPSSFKPVQDLEGTPVGLIVLGSATNGRFDDLRLAAEILKGSEVHPACRLFIIPASRQVYLEALKKGLIRIFAEARTILMPPSMEPYLLDLMASSDSDRRILYTGSWTKAPGLKLKSGDLMICSPATAAASALSASLTEPSRYVR